MREGEVVKMANTNSYDQTVPKSGNRPPKKADLYKLTNVVNNSSIIYSVVLMRQILKIFFTWITGVKINPKRQLKCVITHLHMVRNFDYSSLDYDSTITNILSYNGMDVNEHIGEKR